MPTRFHLMRTEELRNQCAYCGSDLDTQTGWKSEFHLEMHYKTFKCKCGKDHSLKVDFHGSGHDCWDGEKSWDKKTLLEEPEEQVIEEEKKVLDIDELVDEAHEEIEPVLSAREIALEKIRLFENAEMESEEDD